jgi:6-phosphofructokinase 1
MNACVRAVVRSAAALGCEVVGIRHGYRGVLDSDFFVNEGGGTLMTPRSVSHIIQHGGTFLRSSRCEAFRTDEGLKRAADNLRKQKINGLVVIGGDGTFRGAVDLSRHWDGHIVGCPGTIDNDLMGTDYTIGFPTAVATAVEAIDKLRDTAESHERLFLVEVMGRHSGYLALYTAVAAGAEIACVPETPTDVPAMVRHIHELKARGKTSIIVVVAEGDEEGGVEVLNQELREANCPFPTRTVTLGHVQRGGSPSPLDRILASRIGDHAVHALVAGANSVMSGEMNGELVLTPLAETYRDHRPLPDELLKLLERMSC